MALINHNSRSYWLDSIDNELPRETYLRLWKIIQNYVSNTHQNVSGDYLYERLVKISKLWYYKKKFNCKYSDYNEQLIKMF